MLFQSLSFFLLCAATLVAYWRVPALRLWILALANAVFYLAAGWANLGLFLTASLTTFVLGRFVEGPRGAWVVALGTLLNLANLMFFKYAGFVAGTLHPLVGLPFLDPTLVREVLLPIGISFYTFQHISYLVDRRTKALPNAPSYLQFWVYISFFGHSIAGPIMRGHEFFPQIAETTRKVMDGGEFRLGLGLFVLGLTKKVAIADQIAPWVDAFFKHPTALTTGEAWSAALLFAFQIYYDFSAYSDMAVGIGHMFGYTLRRNFLTPYVAANSSEFWTRWHVTLSEWIRDYVYIPLGGNRRGLARAQLNLVLAMLASGLWHGANWTFVLWGAWHGLLAAGGRGWLEVRKRLGWPGFDGPAWRVVATAGFFLLVTYGWVLFRAPDLDAAAAMMRVMVDPTGLPTLLRVKSFLALAAGLYALHWLEYVARRDEVALGRWWLMRVPVAVQGVAYAGLVLVLMGTYDSGQDFIYFRF